MIYKKPGFAYSSDPHSDGISIGSGAGDLLKFLRSLPDSFEIVPEGHVCVKWPEGCSKDALEMSADHLSRFAGKLFTVHALRALAAIAPEEKKPEKRRVYIIQFHGHGENYGKLELSFNANPQFPFVKVGECEVTE